tara:strand:- start:45991 stop:46362 length:372 start_codon:yes stop_codon:yes gene_type:complete
MRVPTLPNNNPFVLSNSPKRHELETPVGTLVVYVKPLSWVAQQEAMSQFVSFKPDSNGEVSPNIDLGGYWKYVLTQCITKTEPAMSKDDLLNLTPEVGAVVRTVLPDLNDIIGQFAGGESPLG